MSDAPDVFKNPDWFMLPEKCSINKNDIIHQSWNDEWYHADEYIGKTTLKRNTWLGNGKTITAYRNRKLYE